MEDEDGGYEHTHDSEETWSEPDDPALEDHTTEHLPDQDVFDVNELHVDIDEGESDDLPHNHAIPETQPAEEPEDLLLEAFYNEAILEEDPEEAHDTPRDDIGIESSSEEEAGDITDMEQDDVHVDGFSEENHEYTKYTRPAMDIDDIAMSDEPREDTLQELDADEALEMDSTVPQDTQEFDGDEFMAYKQEENRARSADDPSHVLIHENEAEDGRPDISGIDEVSQLRPEEAEHVEDDGIPDVTHPEAPEDEMSKDDPSEIPSSGVQPDVGPEDYPEQEQQPDQAIPQSIFDTDISTEDGISQGAIQSGFDAAAHGVPTDDAVSETIGQSEAEDTVHNYPTEDTINGRTGQSEAEDTLHNHPTDDAVSERNGQSAVHDAGHDDEAIHHIHDHTASESFYEDAASELEFLSSSDDADALETGNQETGAESDVLRDDGEEVLQKSLHSQSDEINPSAHADERLISPAVLWSPFTADLPFLHDLTLHDWIGIHKHAFVMYFAFWSGHCKEAMPEFAEAAAKIRDSDLGAELAAVDCGIYQDLCVDEGVDGHPRFYYYFQGHHVADYAGARSIEGFLTFVMSLVEALESDLLPRDAWGKRAFPTIDSVRAVVSESLAASADAEEWGDEYHTGYEKTPSSTEEGDSDQDLLREDVVDDGGEDTSSTGDIGSTSSMDGPTDSSTVVLDEEGMLEDIPKSEAEDAAERDDDDDDAGDAAWGGHGDVAWDESVREVHHLEDRSFNYSLRSRAHMLILFFTPGCELCEGAGRVFTQAAVAMRQDQWLSYATLNCLQFSDVCDAEAVKDHPTVTYYFLGKRVIDYSGDWDAANLMKFITIHAEAQNSTMKIEPAAVTAWTYSPPELIHLTAHSFERWILDREHAFVMFFAPWSGHCKMARPVFAEAVVAMKEDHRIQFAAVDIDLWFDLYEQERVPGVPGFYMYHRGTQVEDYGGDRTVEGFVSFIKEYLSRSHQSSQLDEDETPTEDGVQTDYDDDEYTKYDDVIKRHAVLDHDVTDDDSPPSSFDSDDTIEDTVDSQSDEKHSTLPAGLVELDTKTFREWVDNTQEAFVIFHTSSVDLDTLLIPAFSHGIELKNAWDASLMAGIGFAVVDCDLYQDLCDLNETAYPVYAYYMGGDRRRTWVDPDEADVYTARVIRRAQRDDF